MVNRALEDCGGNFESYLSNRTKALLQCEAEYWLGNDPWCQFLIDCSLPMDVDVHQRLVVRKAKHRRRSYAKFLPDIGIKEHLPLTGLAEALRMDRGTLRKAIDKGTLAAEKRNNGWWYITLLDVAKAMILDSL